MTGQDVIQRVLVDLGESKSTAAVQQMMRYPDHVRFTADQIARRTWSLYKTAVTDIIANQIEYTLPSKPFRDMAMNIVDAYGFVWPIAQITPEQADQQYFGWRDPQNLYLGDGRPRVAIVEGLLTYKLYPVPNYNAQDGLMISGYFGVDKWYDINMESPLQVGADECWIAGVSLRRCKEMRRVDPTYSELIPSLEIDYRTLWQQLYGESVGANAARRGGIIPAIGNRYNLGGGWSWGGSY
jgi:hypothetical protein